MNRIREWKTFWREFRSNFASTGAVLPSSRFLARAITKACAQAPQNARFLEAGPGTGAFTGGMVASLRPGDHLTLCELNERFVEILRTRLTADPAWRAKRAQVEILHGSVEEIAPTERFDAIVCGLPFNNFPPELVDRLFRQFIGHLEEKGSFSFFEYAAIRRLKAPFVAAEERKRLATIADIIERYLKAHTCEDTLVLRNVPPAIVHCLRKG